LSDDAAPVRSRPLRSAATSAAAKMPSGTIAVGVGLAVLGVTSYAFLGIASRALDASSFARLGIVWTVLFTLGPGAFLPLEQEIGRRLAVISDPERAAVVLRRAAGVGLILAAAVTAASFAAIGPIRNRLLNGDLALFGAMIMANLALAPVHISRGVLAGTGRFGRYGVQLAADGTLRVAGAAALSAIAVHRAADFGWVLVGSQLIAVAATLWRVPLPIHTGHDDEALTDPTWSALARGIGWMLAGTMGAQVLANAGPVVVKTLAPPHDAAAGSFLTALILARIPLFLFAALQASLLPGLAKLLNAHDKHAVVLTMRRMLLLLTLLGGAVTLVLLVAGPEITQVLFTSSHRSARLPLVLLSLGSTCYMIGAAIAQVLLAMHRPAHVATVWWLGVIVFAAAVLLPGELPTRVSAAFVAGSLVAAGAFAALFAQFLRAMPNAPLSSEVGRTAP
jgi:O-antigen/teichoic acid export membrane protein